MRLWIAVVPFRDGDDVPTPRVLQSGLFAVGLVAWTVLFFVLGAAVEGSARTTRETALKDAAILQSTLHAQSRAEDIAQLRDCRAEVNAYRNVMQHLLVRLGLDNDPANPDSFVLFLASQNAAHFAKGGPP